MTKNELRRTPLVGKTVVVSEVSGGTYRGLAGKVIEDRVNVLILLNNDKKKVIPKKVCTFEIYEDSQLLGKIKGIDLLGLPQDRKT